MWDLQEIIRQNNEAALNYMMSGQQVNTAQAPLPENWALSVLAKELRVGPPVLSELAEAFADLDTIKEFLRLTRTFLPEHEKDILGEDRSRRVYRFAFLFGQHYFPLPLNTDCGIRDLIGSMPVALMGMSYSAYHDLGMRIGYLLLLSLVPYPYEGDDRDEEDDSVPFNPAIWSVGKYKPSPSDIQWLKDLVNSLAIDGEWFAPMGFSMKKIADNTIRLSNAEDTDLVKDTIKRTLLVAKRAGIEAEFRPGRTADEKTSGARVPLLDAVRGIVGEDIALRIPGGGWAPKQLHKITDGTKYDGVGAFADWTLSNTGCTLLDANYDDCEFREGWGEPTFSWSEYNVKILTEQWPKVAEIRSKIDGIVDWIEKAPIPNFNELLTFIEGAHPEKITAPKEKHFYDPTEHWIGLEQSNPEEDEQDDE
ncbi:hypothetical protein ES703_52868 [subsurface metagenome]